MSLDALKTAKKAIGVKQTTKAVEKSLAQLVYLAENADQRITAPLKDLCSQKSVAVEMIATMEELGKACAIEVGAAAVAVLK